jgi:hypothetical protein
MTVKIARILIAGAAALLLFAAPAVRSDEAGKKTMDTVRDALRADKKALVASTLQLSDAEAKAFWPLYDKYQKDLITANNKLYQVIEEYALAHNQNKLDDAKALDIVHRYFSADESRTKVRSSYVKEFSKVLPGLKVARFYQIENKLDAVVRYEMAERIPLMKQ